MTNTTRTTEINRRSSSGYLMLAVGFVLILLGLFLIATPPAIPSKLFVGIVALAAGMLVFSGLYMLQPNEAAILLLFGEYSGTDRSEGLRWANPFLRKKK